MATVTGYVPAPGETDPQKLARAIRNLYEYLTGLSLAPGPNQAACRITLTTGTPVTASDVASAATVYLTAVGGQYVPVYDGSNWTAVDVSTDLSVALDSNSGHTNYHQSGKNFDVFVATVSGTTYFGTGPKWNDGAVAGSDTTRGTGAGSTQIETFNGIMVNKNSMTLRFGSASGNTVTVPARQALLVGSIRTTADGTTEDSILKRFVSNVYFAEFREMAVTDTTDNWVYSTAAFQQKNASASNQVEWLHCVAGRAVILDERGFVTNLGASVHEMAVGIGIDSTTTNSARRVIKVYINNTSFGPQMTSATFNGYAGLGYHKACELEYGGGADTQIWFGDNGVGVAGSGVTAPLQTGMEGRTPN